MSAAPNLVFLALLLASVGCGAASDPAPVDAPAPEAPAAEPVAPAAPLPDPSTLPDVVLITLDTTRADRLGSYGYPLARTDTLDALAAGGRRFARAYSPLPLTIPSHATMFTGQYPPEHGIRSNSDQVLEPESVTLAERLREAGYRTGASVAAFVTTRRFGFDQGFDAFYDDVEVGRDRWHAERPAKEVVDDIVSWEGLVSDGRPRFAWVHLYDAHFPYQATEEYVKATEGRLYDAELAMIDDQVARLVAAFADRPTVFVVIGDHGEGLGDHIERAHGLQVYNATQHVPFFMSGPGIPAGEVVDAPVSLADLTPTLLDLLGLPPLADVSGKPALARGDAPIYMEAYDSAHRFGVAPPIGVVQGAHKLIMLPRPELYDVVADPREERDLAAAMPERVNELAAHLKAWSFPPPKGGVADVGGDGDVSAALEALGYVSGSMEFDPDAVLPDPKDCEDLFRGLEKVERSRDEDGSTQVDVLTDLIAKYPKVTEFYIRLSKVYRKLGKRAEAARIVEQGLEVRPDNLALRLERASDLVAERKFEDASLMFQDLAETAASLSPRVRVLAVTSLMQAGKPGEAMQLAYEYAQKHPDDHNLAGFIGNEMVRIGRYDDALAFLQRGLLADVPEVNVAMQLAAAATGRGEREEAMRLLQLEVKFHPTNGAAVGALGRLLLMERRPGEVLDLVQPRLERWKQAQDLYFLAAQAHYNLGQFPQAREVLDRGFAVNDPPLADLLMLDANLLKQEGKPEAAEQRFQAALARREQEKAEAARAAQPPKGPIAPSEAVEPAQPAPATP